MNLKSIVLIAGSLATTATLRAGPRTSADYAITTDTVDTAGQHTASAGGLYGNDGSAGAIIAVSSAAAVGEIARHGFIGQLYELLGYGLLASDYYPPEAGTTQLFPVRTADDGTNVVIPTTGFLFVPLEGPIPGISATGLVSTSNVYQNTDAIVGATSPQFPGLLTLTLHVQDTIPDNYSTYAGDGLPDSWQFQYFGLNNPLAAPGADASGTGQTNLFKYTAGLDPLDPNSRFVLEIHEGLTPAEKRLVFYPRLPGRTYEVEFRLSLSDGQWDPLVGAAFVDQAEIRTVNDPNAGMPARFYRVRITKP